MMESKKKQKGMTFLELMVAIFVLIVGISGTVGLIHRTIASASMAASQLKAAYLAQEGIEVVRNIRDTNWVRGRDWLVNLSNCICCEAAFNHDANTPMSACPGGTPRRLIFFNGFYGYATGANARESVFRRGIRTETIGDLLRVEATISWVERGATRTVIVVENLYDWR